MFSLVSLLFSEVEQTETLYVYLLSASLTLSGTMLLMDCAKMIAFYTSNQYIFYYLTAKIGFISCQIVLDTLQLVFFPRKEDYFVTFHSFSKPLVVLYLLITFRFEFLLAPAQQREEKKKQRKYVEQSIIPFDRVLWILNDIKTVIDAREEIILKDIDYCIKIIANNKIFTPDYENEENSDDQIMALDGRKKRNMNAQRVQN